VDAATGDVRWKWRSRRSKMSMPTVADHIVYAASHNGRMWAVDGRTGRPVWNAKVADYRTPHNPAPTVTDGVLYAAVDEHLVALDTATGDRRWDVFPHGGVQKTPTVTDGIAYVGNGKGLLALDAATGEERRRLETQGEVCSSPVVADGTVYVGSKDDFLYAIHT
jgi:outer membrane protein assembly factor BamB